MFSRALKIIFEKENKKQVSVNPKMMETYFKNLDEKTKNLIKYIAIISTDLSQSRNQQTIQDKDIWGSLFALFELDSNAPVQNGKYTSVFLKQASSFMKKTLENYHNIPVEKGRRISNMTKTGLSISTSVIKSLMKEAVPAGTRISGDAVVLLTSFTCFLLRQYLSIRLETFHEKYPNPTEKQKEDFFQPTHKFCSFLSNENLPEFERSYCIFSNMIP